MKTNFATMHSALSDAYMVLNKAHMDYRPIPTAELVRVLGVLEQALAIKPRNCDRFATVDEAMEYHKRTNCAARRYCAYRDGCPTDGTCVVNWLLAKATEGGAK